MLDFINQNAHILITIISGALLLASEIMGLSKNPSSAKGFIDGLLKLVNSNEPPAPKQ